MPLAARTSPLLRAPLRRPAPLRGQRYFSKSNVGDVFQGHGTHVGGSAVGATPAPSATEYSGVAPEAKLAFDDISTDGEELFPPDDLNLGLFPHSYAAGAR